MILFPPRLSFANLPTPLMPIDRFTTQLEKKIKKTVPRIWIKRDDLTGSELSGNKVRKLEFVVAEAKNKGCNTLITCGALQSNHCRATAIVGAKAGMKVHLLLRSETAELEGNYFLDLLTGAKTSIYPPSEFNARRDELFQEWKDFYESQGDQAFLIPTGASDEIGIWGYLASCNELKKDFESLKMFPEHIITSTGSGGTHSGLILGNEIFKLNAKIWGVNVCDDREHFYKKHKHDIAAWKKKYRQTINAESFPFRILDQYSGPKYGVAEKYVYDIIKELAQLEGIILDPVYTGKAFYGMVQEIIKDETFYDAKNIVFIHTGGIFGVFSHKDQFFPKEENK